MSFFFRSGGGNPTILVIHHTADAGNDIQSPIIERAHKAAGYKKGTFGNHTAYHYIVGRDGTVKQLHSLHERTGATRNAESNAKSISIVVAGNFQDEKVNPEQKEALSALVKKLNARFAFTRIIGHRDVEGSPTQCPGENLYHLIPSL